MGNALRLVCRDNASDRVEFVALQTKERGIHISMQWSTDARGSTDEMYVRLDQDQLAELIEFLGAKLLHL